MPRAYTKGFSSVEAKLHGLRGALGLIIAAGGGNRPAKGRATAENWKEWLLRRDESKINCELKVKEFHYAIEVFVVKVQ